jgi:hypothetical protein
MKVLLAMLVLAPVVLLVVQSIRGRARVSACCSVPAESDARLRPYDDAARLDEVQRAQSAPSGPAAH